MLTPVHGFSLEPPASEVEFLRRELGIQWSRVTQEELLSHVSTAERTLVLMSEPEPYRSIVQQAPAGSIVCVMISDEAYSLERLTIAKQPAIYRVYRHYPCQPASWARVAGSAAGYVRDSRGTSQRARTVVPNMRSGMRVRTRMKQWQTIESKVSPIPLGYTDTFAHAFAQRFALSSHESVFTGDPFKNVERGRSVAFRGNRGLAQRIVGIERAKSTRGSEITLIEADWSARAEDNGGAAYVDSLVSARFVLCPPGFANNESFRFYEALACGALPIEISVATTHLGELVWRKVGSITKSSWTKSLHEAESMLETERRKQVPAARTLVTKALWEAAESIRDDLESP